MRALIWSLIGLGILLTIVAVEWAVAAAQYYSKFHGKRLITCPETQENEAVEVAAVSGACTAMFQPNGLKLRACTRWPERADCVQLCLNQIEHAPADCLITNIVSKWYAGKRCVYCRSPFEPIHWHERQPALLDAAGKTTQWSQVQAERLPQVLAASQPVCWNCHVAETFRREHEELVTERDFDQRRPAA